MFAINSSEHRANPVLIQFAKGNAGCLHEILKNGQFSWQNFDGFDSALAGININHTREKKTIDHSIFQDFERRSSQNCKERCPQAIAQPVLDTGFGIGTRKGDCFLRVCRTEDNFLKFELEIKKGRAKNCQDCLSKLPQTFTEFEDLTAARFCRHLEVALVLDTKFADWLVVVLRQTNKPFNHSVASCVSTNTKLEETSDLEQQRFHRLLQFSSFCRSHCCVDESLSGEPF